MKQLSCSLYFFVLLVDVIYMIINLFFPFLISVCTQDEYRRKRRDKEHIAFQCEDHAQPQPEAAPRPLPEEELLAEEDGLAPAAPAAVAVNADLPEEEGAVIVELGAPPDPGLIRVGPLVRPQPQPLPTEGPQAPSFDLRPEDVPFGPQLLVDPGMTEEEARRQDAVPVTYKYLPTGSKQGKSLVVASNGFTYSKRYPLKTGGVVYRCTHRPPTPDLLCMATVTRRPPQCEGGEDSYVRNDSRHNHIANAIHAYGREAFTQLRTDAVAHIEVPSSALRERVIANLFPSADQRHNAPRNSCISRTIQVLRQKKRPKEPTSVTDPLDFEWLSNHCPDLKVLMDQPAPGQGRTLAFSTDFLLRECSQALTWCVDGTFKSRPAVYKDASSQVFSIHAFVGGPRGMKHFRMIFALMKHRTT